MEVIIGLIALVALLMGYGAFKLHPIAGTVAGVVVALLVLGIMLSAVLGVGGFLAFFTASTWALYLTAFSTSYVVGTVLSAIF